MEPLVLIHGFSGIPAMWDPMLPALQERFDVRSLGLAGHFGCAAFPEGTAASTSALFDALERDLDAAGFETAHICGNSLGGWAALELAKRGRARSCVAIAPAGGWERGSKQERRLMPLFKRLYKTSVWANPRREKLFLRPKARKLAMRDVVEHGERMTRARRPICCRARPSARSTGTCSRRSAATARRRTSTASSARRRSSGARRTGSSR